MQEKIDVVLVIRPVLRAGQHAFDHHTIEVPRATAEEQLNTLDAQRHATWRGVRYATPEENRAFYNVPEPELQKTDVVNLGKEALQEKGTEPKVKTKKVKEESL
jgi:hypothetical protein